MKTIMNIILLVAIFASNQSSGGTKVFIPDVNFRTFLQTTYPAFMSGDSLIVDSAATLTGELNCSGQNIVRLNGVEFFKNIVTLNCKTNQLKDLPNISGLTKLQLLKVSYNYLTVLPDLSSISSLVLIECNNNLLEKLPDLSSNININYFYCYYNKLDFSDARELLIIDKLPNMIDYIYSPQYPFGEQDTVIYCASDLIKLSFSKQDSAASYQWYKNGSPVANATDTSFTISNFLPADTGTYTLKSFGTSLSTMMFPPGFNAFVSSTIELQIFSPFQCTMVWPGDANGNNAVGFRDLFPIGLLFGRKGYSRPKISYDWDGVLCGNWGDTLRNGNDIKHADCNGDGYINKLDIYAVRKNFKKFHLKTNEVQQTYNAANPDLYFEVLTPNVAPGTEVEVKIMAGKDSISLYGIEFQVNLNTALIDTNTIKVKWDNSWIGDTATNMITIDTTLYDENIVYGACTRMNQTEVKDSGEIARLTFKVRSDLVSADTLDLALILSTEGGVSASGDSMTFNVSTDTVKIYSGFIDYKIEAKKIKIFPNPANELVVIDLPENLKNFSFNLLDVIGKVVYTSQYQFGGKHEISVANFPKGLYLVSILTEVDVYQQKLIVQ